MWQETTAAHVCHMPLMTFGVTERGLDVRRHLGVQMLSDKYNHARSDDSKCKQRVDEHHPRTR